MTFFINWMKIPKNLNRNIWFTKKKLVNSIILNCWIAYNKTSFSENRAICVWPLKYCSMNVDVNLRSYGNKYLTICSDHLYSCQRRNNLYNHFLSSLWSYNINLKVIPCVKMVITHYDLIVSNSIKKPYWRFQLSLHQCLW